MQDLTKHMSIMQRYRSFHIIIYQLFVFHSLSRAHFDSVACLLSPLCMSAISAMSAAFLSLSFISFIQLFVFRCAAGDIHRSSIIFHSDSNSFVVLRCVVFVYGIELIVLHS